MNCNRKTKEVLICGLIATAIFLFVCGQTYADYVFSSAVRLGSPVNSPDPSDYEWYPRISADGLELAYFRNFGDTQEVWIATRATLNDPWDSAVHDVPGIGPGEVVIPGVTTADGLEFYGYWYDSPEGYGDSDLYFLTRETMESPWSEPINVGPPVNTQYAEALMSVSLDGLELYFSDYGRYRPGGYGREDIWVAKRTTQNDPWQEPVNLGSQVNSPANDSRVHISADGLLLFFDSRRSAGHGESDLYMARRKTLSDPWEEAINLGPNVNSSGSEYNPCISLSGHTLIFVRNEDLWQANVEPVVDLNNDGIVDAADMCIMVDNWGTDNPLCDIGPTPFGDGVVDVQDLIVLAGHLFEEFPPADPNL